MADMKMIDGVLIELTAEEITEREVEADLFDKDLRHTREVRTNLLGISDWTQVADAPLTAEKVAEWATYRQELRDYPAQSDRKSTLPEWPTPPE
jgi:hypothetical protein|tara:strand:+ start:1903 stop:2184 length:282 start_codon:yes stop_codon:yes gene_type:complete